MGQRGEWAAPPFRPELTAKLGEKSSTPICVESLVRLTRIFLFVSFALTGLCLVGADEDPVVYVTMTGSKYHTED